MGFFFEGSVFVFDLNFLFWFLGVSKIGWFVLCMFVFWFFFIILLRVLCFIVLFVIIFLFYIFLFLEYVFFGFFFMNIVFFVMINGWYIKVLFEGFKKCLLVRCLLYYYSRLRVVSDGNFINGMELNNVILLI